MPTLSMTVKQMLLLENVVLTLVVPADAMQYCNTDAEFKAGH